MRNGADSRVALLSSLRALNKFGVKYFEEIFKPYMVEKLESSSKEYSNTYEIIDQSE